MVTRKNPLAAQQTATYLNETLFPALGNAWEFIDTKILPIFGTVYDWLFVQLPTALATASSNFIERWNAIQVAIESAWSVISAIFNAIRDFANWLANTVFSFTIEVPDVPDWMIPGSPIPLHTAWDDFGNYLNNTTFQPKFDTSQINQPPPINVGNYQQPIAPINYAAPAPTQPTAQNITYMTINVNDNGAAQHLKQLIQELRNNSQLIIKEPI